MLLGATDVKTVSKYVDEIEPRGLKLKIKIELLLALNSFVQEIKIVRLNPLILI